MSASCGDCRTSHVRIGPMQLETRRALATDMPVEEIRRFHDVLTAAGYNEEGLVSTLGPIMLPTRRLQDQAHFNRLTRAGRPLDSQIRLFLLGFPVPLEEARAALAPVPLAEWVRAGLLAADETQANGLVRLMAFRHLLVACDLLDLDATAQPDTIMPITSSTATLADSMVPRRSRASLDLGTGTGALALLLAGQSDRVWGVDISPRAVNFARFNAALNAAGSHVEILQGDAFEPLAGQTFDLIVSNPPFAISPSHRYIYRDSGLPADSFVRHLVETAAGRLNEQGYCQIVCQWAHVAGQDWKERLAGWFAGSGCDAWVMATDTQDTPDYARSWIRDTEQVTAEESDRLYDDWLAYYERERIEAVNTGLIMMRKASGKTNWLRFEEGPGTTSGPYGAEVALGFELRDFLESLGSGEALLEARLKVAPSARLDHVCEWEDDAWRIRSARIRLAAGLQYSANIDLRLAGVVALCDGRTTLREVLTRSAAALKIDFERLAPACLPITRQLIERGYLLPAG
jgi:SAM-dependent methyltransferase